MSVSRATKVALIGAGVMGEAILAGLLNAGYSSSTIVATDRRPERQDELAQKYGITMRGNVEAVTDAGVVIIVVKPYDVSTVLGEISEVLDPNCLVVSLAAGVTTSHIESLVHDGQPVIRVMPNTPAQVAQGMSVVSAGSNATDEQVELVTSILASTGRAVAVPEKHQDAATAVSGSGPAYLFLVAESMVEAAVQMGLTRDVATELVVQTLYGGASLLKETGEHPTILRERVTSPGGTTAAALRTLEDRGLRSSFMAAMEAARDRSVELGTAEDSKPKG